MPAADPATRPTPAENLDPGTAAPVVPANDAGSEPPPIPPKRHYGDWQAGVRLLAEGRSEQEVAEALGTTVAKDRRNRRESGRLRRWIEEERQTLQELALLRLEGARHDICDRMIDDDPTTASRSRRFPSSPRRFSSLPRCLTSSPRRFASK